MSVHLENSEKWQLACTAPPKEGSLVSCFGLFNFLWCGSLALVNGSINANKYIDILEDNFWVIIACHFPANNTSSRMTTLQFIELVQLLNTS